MVSPSVQSAVLPMLSGPTRALDFFMQRRESGMMSASEGCVEARQGSRNVPLLGTRKSGKNWWAWVDLNHRPRPYQGNVVRSYNNIQDRGDCQTPRKSYKTSEFVGWVVGWESTGVALPYVFLAVHYI